VDAYKSIVVKVMSFFGVFSGATTPPAAPTTGAPPAIPCAVTAA
jgi:hypothetical protein